MKCVTIFPARAEGTPSVKNPLAAYAAKGSLFTYWSFSYFRFVRQASGVEPVRRLLAHLQYSDEKRKQSSEDATVHANITQHLGCEEETAEVG
jgi:hypothetical protein